MSIGMPFGERGRFLAGKKSAEKPCECGPSVMHDGNGDERLSCRFQNPVNFEEHIFRFHQMFDDVDRQSFIEGVFRKSRVLYRKTPSIKLWRSTSSNI